MKTIRKCVKCGRVRLVSNRSGEWICYACKQGKTKPEEMGKIEKAKKKIKNKIKK